MKGLGGIRQIGIWDTREELGSSSSLRFIDSTIKMLVVPSVNSVFSETVGSGYGADVLLAKTDDVHQHLPSHTLSVGHNVPEKNNRCCPNARRKE